MKAMKAYEQDKKPNVGEIIKLENIPGKWEKKYETFIEDFYHPIYVKKLDDLEYDYKDSRLLDRALWVYGHGFLER